LRCRGRGKKQGANERPPEPRKPHVALRSKG
jgi:hypothetical protein